MTKFSYLLLLLEMVGCLTHRSLYGAVQIKPSVHNFGQVVRGTVLGKTFILKNLSKQGLYLRGIQFPPGVVLQTELPKEPLKTGQQFELRLDWHTEAFSGAVSRKITLALGKGPFFRVLELKAQINSPFVVKPSLLEFGEVHEGKAVPAKTVSIEVMEDSKLDGFGFQLQYNEKHLQITKVWKNGRLALQINPKWIPINAYFKEGIVVSHNQSHIPPFTVWVTGYYKKAVVTTTKGSS